MLRSCSILTQLIKCVCPLDAPTPSSSTHTLVALTEPPNTDSCNDHRRISLFDPNAKILHHNFPYKAYFSLNIKQHQTKFKDVKQLLLDHRIYISRIQENLFTERHHTHKPPWFITIKYDRTRWENNGAISHVHKQLRFIHSNLKKKCPELPIDPAKLNATQSEKIDIKRNPVQKQIHPGPSKHPSLPNLTSWKTFVLSQFKTCSPTPLNSPQASLFGTIVHQQFYVCVITNDTNLITR